MTDAVRLTLEMQFFAVLPHELGHLAGAWMAGIRRGTLFWGGVFGAYYPLDKSAFGQLTPGQRVVVFGLGPVCNLLMAGLGFGLYYVLPLPIRGYVFSLRNHIIALNLILLVNLLPVFPLDGGRLLKEFLLLFQVGSRHIILCLRSAALVFGAGLLVVLIRYGIWTDWLLWGLVLAASTRVLGGKRSVVEGYGD